MFANLCLIVNKNALNYETYCREGFAKKVQYEDSSKQKNYFRLYIQYKV